MNLSKITWRDIFGPAPKDPELQPIYNRLHPNERQAFQVRWESDQKAFDGVAAVMTEAGEMHAGPMSPTLAATLLLLCESIREILGPRRVVIFRRTRTSPEESAAWVAIDFPVLGGTGNDQYLHATPWIMQGDPLIETPHSLDEGILGEVAQLVGDDIPVLLPAKLVDKLPGAVRAKLKKLLEKQAEEADPVKEFEDLALG